MFIRIVKSWIMLKPKLGLGQWCAVFSKILLRTLISDTNTRPVAPGAINSDINMKIITSYWLVPFILLFRPRMFLTISHWYLCCDDENAFFMLSYLSCGYPCLFNPSFGSYFDESDFILFESTFLFRGIKTFMMLNKYC